MNILLPVVVLGALGVIFGVWLGFMQKLFFVKKDPRIEQILSLLPGSNCGACGQAGCYGLAETLAKGELKSITCPVVHEQEREDIADALGINVAQAEKNVATLICGGGTRCKDNFQYHGIEDCNIATLVMNGPKSCTFGCIGFGSCVQVCLFNAIRIGKDGLPEIDPAKCTSCGKCIKACPKGVLLLAPLNKIYHVECNSHDKGADVIRSCKVGCIACGKCVKTCPVSAIELKDNVAVIDYTKCTNCGQCVAICPTKAIRTRRDGAQQRLSAHIS